MEGPFWRLWVNNRLAYLVSICMGASFWRDGAELLHGMVRLVSPGTFGPEKWLFFRLLLS